MTNHIAKEEMINALSAIDSMISRSEKAQQNLAQGTSQYALQKNRIHALSVASSLVKQELNQQNSVAKYTTEQLEQAKAPIVSLISKSSKAQQKVAAETWQFKMLEINVSALNIALPLLECELEKRTGSPL